MSTVPGRIEAEETRNAYGQTLSSRYAEVRLNSVGHLVVPMGDRPPFMLGVDTEPHGLVVDFHCPFLRQVPRDGQMLEIIAMNSELCTLGSVRVVPEGDATDFFVLELRHQVHAALLTDEWVHYYANLIPDLGSGLIQLLRPALGGEPILA